MTEVSDYKESLLRELQKYDAFLENAKTVNDAIPLVAELRDETMLKLDAVNNVPADYLTETLPGLLRNQIDDEKRRTSKIPHLPHVNISPTTVSSSSTTDFYVTVIDPLLTSELQPPWLEPIKDAFNQYADNKARRIIPPSLFAAVDSNLSEQFNSLAIPMNRQEMGYWELITH